MSSIIGNRYQITKLIGKGGMAEVYLAWDSILNREVAVKILKSDMSDDDVALERFKREAGATTQLSHPNIVDVYDVGDDKTNHYIVMEYIKGYSLKQLIKKRGAIPYKETVWMMKQLAGALMEAHRKGIIHRDIKSQNVLIKPDGTIKLSDFGIALANGCMQLTSKNSVLGSVHYLAPELSKGHQASMQSDIYSLGIVFYELLTGDVPFKADTPVQVALKHVKENIPSVRKINMSIPQSVENIIIKATAKSLSNRYKNIALMLNDLNECLKQEHLNDERIDFSSNNINSFNISLDSSEKVRSKNNNSKLIIIMISIFSIISIVVLLFLSGVFGSKSKYINVPDIRNLTVIEAKDLLAESKLLIDDANISYEMSDSIEKDKIISVSPDVDEQIHINSKIKIVVSRGIYSKLDNYVGKNYIEAKNDLINKNFNVNFIPISDDNKQAGAVVEQSLEPGYKYDSEINNEITLTYVKIENFIIEQTLSGMDIDEAKKYFEDNGVKYKLEILDKELLSEDELKNAKPYTVLKTDPDIGSSVNLDSDSIVAVYYYEGD